MIRTTESTQLRIIVADDFDATAEILAKLLRRWGHEVRTATTGSDAVEAAENFQPQVMFVDILMPNLDGYEVAKQIRKEPWGKNVFLVALSGLGREEDRQQSREAGFDTHLLKPVWSADLKHLIEAFTNTAREPKISSGLRRNTKLPIPRPV
jgi:two-component system, chemotaxis family, CheB/CheR fusion protein